MLSYTELMELVEQGVITNVTPDMVNGSSIDVTLGNVIELEVHEQPTLNYCTQSVALHKREALKTYSFDMSKYREQPYRFVRDGKRGYFVQPGEFILAHTEQEFHLPADITATYYLKSTMGRIGLEHLNAGHCDPYWHDSVLTLELMNMTRYHEIFITPGCFIGQMVFHRHTPVPEEAGYHRRGHYNNDKSVSGVKR